MKAILSSLIIICIVFGTLKSNAQDTKLINSITTSLDHSLTASLEESDFPYYEFMMDTLCICPIVDTCLHFTHDSTQFLNGTGNWVTIDSVRQPYKYVAYGDSANYITGDNLFTRDPLKQTIMLRKQGTATTGLFCDTAVQPFTYVIEGVYNITGIGIPGTGISWLDSTVNTYAGVDVIQDPYEPPYPAIEIMAGDSQGNNIGANFHIDNVYSGVRDWRLNQTAYNGALAHRVMCNLSSAQWGDVHGELEASSDSTNEKSNLGFFVSNLTFSHTIPATNVNLGCTLDSSGFSFYNFGASGLGIGGYHFPQTHGSAGQVLTDNGIGQLFWGNSSTSQPFTEIAYGNPINQITGDTLFTRDTIGQTTILRKEGSAIAGFLSDTAVQPFSALMRSVYSMPGICIPGVGISWLDTSLNTYSGVNVIMDPFFIPNSAIEIIAGDFNGNNIGSNYHIDDTTGGIRNWRINQSAINPLNQSKVQCDLASNMYGDVYGELQASNDTSNEGTEVGLSIHQLALGYSAPSSSTSINSIACTLDSNGFRYWNYTAGSSYTFPRVHGNAGQVITDDGGGNLAFIYSGVLGGEFSSLGDTTANAVTVMLPMSIPSGYKVVITPSNTNTAAFSYWVDTKTTTSFNVNFSGTITAAYITFDWILTP